MNRLGIQTVGAFGMSPVEYANPAVDRAGAKNSPGLGPGDIDPHACARFDSQEDNALPRAVKAALRDRGMANSPADALTVRSGVEPPRKRPAQLPGYGWGFPFLANQLKAGAPANQCRAPSSTTACV